MYNHNIRARKKEAKKIDYVVLQQKRVMEFLDMIGSKKEISAWDLQKILKIGPGTYERIARIVKDSYKNEVNWNKKTRNWEFIPLQQDIPVAEQVKDKLLEKQIG